MPEHGYDNVSDSKRYGFADGYYRSGDLGLQDARGRLFIRGRQSAFIDTGGYKVEPQEVEEIIKEHPAVREVAVVGVAASDVGEIVKAVIVPTGTGDAQQIKAYCRDRLAGYKVPRIVEFRTELPRSPLGKILKGELLACHDRPEAGRPDVAPLEAVETPAPSLYDEIVACSKRRVDVLVSRIQTQIAAMLNRGPSNISRHATFEQLGFDSLLAIEFCSWLEKSLGVSCPITVVWNYPTPDALARMLLEQLHLTEAPTGLSTGRNGLQAAMSTQVLGDLPIAARLTEIESLSESEVYESLSKRF
jgi:long-chain acyl-CoA synthetase